MQLVIALVGSLLLDATASARADVKAKQPEEMSGR